MKLRRITALFLLFTAIAVAACSEGAGDTGITVTDPIGAPESGSEQSSTSAVRSAAPSVMKSASVQIDVVQAKLNSAAQAVVDLATSTKVGGFLVSSIVDTDEGYGFGNIVVKVPAPHFEQTVADLGTVGEVTRQQLDGHDLSGEFLANHAALRQTRGRIESLLRRIDGTKDPAVRFDLRQHLGTAREQLRNIRQDASQMNAQSSYSTIDVALTGTPPPAPPEKPAFKRALGTAKDITLGIASGIVLTAGVVVPIGLLLFALYLIAVPVIRRFKPRLKSDPV